MKLLNVTRPGARLRDRALCCLICFAPGAAGAQELAGDPASTGAFGELIRHAESVPVVLSVSGGISKGVYQAGVNWGLLEIFKLTAHDSIRTAWNLPNYDLKAMAGASAGNINGFLTAIEWCSTEKPIPADNSLFWKTWMRPGFDQLLPDEHDPTTGVLTRRYYDRVVLEELRKRMARPDSIDPPENCDVPVGVTVTKLTPGRIEISGELDAATQRFASVVRVSRTSPRSIEFLSPGPKIRKTDKLGRLIFLPARDDNVIPQDTVFNLVKASSAFPGAFAPVRLAYDVPGEDRDSAAFSDGGLFDNSPVALAAGIYAVAIRENPEVADAATLIHISPLKLRGRYDSALVAAENTVEVEEGGIGALLTLLAGAVPSALEYELHSFARLLEWAPHVFERDNIAATTRAVPVIGEQLAGFGAFLGRPFREFDFYVGVYDALYFFSREACRPDSSNTADSAEAVSQRDRCVKTRLYSLIDTTGTDFGRFASSTDTTTVHLARSVLHGLYEWEWEGGADLNSILRPSGVATPREILVLALLRTNLGLADLIVADSLNECTDRDRVKALLCANGFRRMLDDFADEAVRGAIEQAVGTAGACAPKQWETAPEHCVADESFRDFIRNPEQFVVKAIERLLYQVWRVERGIEKRAEGGGDRRDAIAWSGVATLSELLFQSSIGYRYRRGFEWNTSSAPRRARAGVVASIVPNYASFSLGSGGLELGYRPTVHVSNSFSLGATLAPLHLITDAPDNRHTYRWVVGPTLHWKRTGVLWSGLSTGVDFFGRWSDGQRPDETEHVWAIPVTLYFIADKVRVNIRFVPNNDSEVHSGVAIGLSDLNGLAYWALRGLGIMR